MNTSGEAADQVMRMMLEGSEVLIKLSGKGAKNAVVLLYSILKEQNKTRGHERLSNMLRSGKPLKVYTFKRNDLEQFKKSAKEYGILYCILKEKDDKDGVFDVLVRADDDSKLARITERFNLTHVDTATLRTEIMNEKKAKAEAEKKAASGQNPDTATADGKNEPATEQKTEPETEETEPIVAGDDVGDNGEKEHPVKDKPDKEQNMSDLNAVLGKENPEDGNPTVAREGSEISVPEKSEGMALQSKGEEQKPLTTSSLTLTEQNPTEPSQNVPESATSESPSQKKLQEGQSNGGRINVQKEIEKKRAERAARAKAKTQVPEAGVTTPKPPVKPKER